MSAAYWKKYALVPRDNPNQSPHVQEVEVYLKRSSCIPAPLLITLYQDNQMLSKALLNGIAYEILQR